MIKKHEIILSVVLSFFMVVLVVGVGLYVFNNVSLGFKACLNYTAGINQSEMIEYKPTGEMINCSAWLVMNESAAQGRVDGREKWAWLDNNIGWILFIIIMIVVLYFINIGAPVFGKGGK